MFFEVTYEVAATSSEKPGGEAEKLASGGKWLPDSSSRESWVELTWGTEFSIHSLSFVAKDVSRVKVLLQGRKGERGCSGSHIALWKQCAKRDDPSKPMLILEDDAVLWDKSGVHFPELCHRLIAATEQCWDVANEPVILYVGCEVRARHDAC